MAVIDEPLLQGSEIQGDSLAGFRKDHVALLFLAFDEKQIVEVKRWLLTLQLSTLDVVHAFNSAYRILHRRFGGDPPLKACWMNVGFTAPGLKKLVSAADVALLGVAFNAGAHARASVVGDPEDGSPGDPRHWVIGGPNNVPDAMLIIAGDEAASVAAAVRRVRADIRALSTKPPVRVMYKDKGRTLRGALRGHEHFGFKDGISQPGVRGRIDSPTHPLVTPRYIDPSDPLGDTYAAPGQPLLWPGEFILGYPRNDQDDPLLTRTDPVAPDWSRNGTFLVFRRLYQDVPAFRRFIETGTRTAAADGRFGPMNEARFGALCVGRWKSGAPIARAPFEDNPDIAASPIDAANSFSFDIDTVPVKWNPSTGREEDTLPPARRDFDGVICPLSAHIRKINPRDEATDQGDSPRTLQHRIVRRGIPYGEEYDPTQPGSETLDRGLLFIAYQSSIERQFEFLQQDWVNLPNAPRDPSGVDPILGAKGLLRLMNDEDKVLEIPVTERFVIATGAAYLFVPSIGAMRYVLTKP